MIITPDSLMLSSPSGTAQQCIQYILGRLHGEYDEASVIAIVEGYFDTCTQAEMDPVMVIAQMLHETGNISSWWSQRPRRNPAGIGVTGRKNFADNRPRTGAWERHGNAWDEGNAFPTWAHDAIPAHVGRLLAYTLRADYGTPRQRYLIEYALGIRGLPESYRGAAPTWRGLNGRWAVPGKTYAQKIIELQERITK